MAHAKKTYRKRNRIPYHYKPDHLSYEEWQIGLRRQFAAEQKYTFKNLGEHPVYSDFELSGSESKKIYKIAIRTENIGLNFCSCPDFSINTLGTCKHIEYVLQHLKRNRKTLKFFKERFINEYSSVCLRYGEKRSVLLRIGSYESQRIKALSLSYFDENNILREEAFEHFEAFLEKAVDIDAGFRCYSDALDYIIAVRDQRKRTQHIEERYPDGISSELLSTLVKIDLHPYQKEAVLFAAKAGRCIIADEMGLGKTLEAIATAELMAREFGVEKVLIVCPTSLSYQWKSEIERCTGRTAHVIEGLSHTRHSQYMREEFYKIVTYNVLCNDRTAILKMAPDLIILDEAQRIKNWKTKTAQNVKSLRSPYALVLTGTPLENRLEELHSITEFIDRFRLGPLFRFLANHQIIDKSGKVIGYRNLHKIAQTVSPILIRRTKKEVLQEMPSYSEENRYVSVTEQQMEIHDEHYVSVSRLVNKWRRYKFLSEKERQMLLVHLNCMRMVSNSTYILDQETRFDTKVDELMHLFEEIRQTPKKKVVIFSQWERMTRLVAQEFEKINISYEHLHGGVPGKKRKDLIHRFHHDDESLVFLSTDAGGVGLNLQCASFVINLDCPWNPAVLAQRIGRVYRLGQKNAVTVINFISSGTIEEMIQSTLRFKKSVFDGVLNGGADEVLMGETKFQQFMKGIDQMIKPSELLSPPPQTSAIPVPTDATSGERSHAGLKKSGTSEQPDASSSSADTFQTAVQNLLSVGLNFLPSLSSFVEHDRETGKKTLKIPMPSEDAIQKAADALGHLLQALKKE